MQKGTKQHVMRLILLTVLLLMAAIVCQPAKAQAAKEKFRIAKGWLGDVDANGTVNGNDLDKLLKYLNGWKTCTAEKVFGDADGDGEYSENDKTLSDLNRDGKVDALDAVILQRCLDNWSGYASQYHVYIPELEVSMVNSSTPAKMDVKTAKATLQVLIRKGLSPYTVEWYRDGLKINSATTETSEGVVRYEALQPGTYYAIVKDSGNWSKQTVSREVTAEPLSIKASASKVSSTLPAKIYVEASGGCGDYSYEWFLKGESVGKTTVNYISAGKEGTYTCTVTDSTWQTASCTIEVEDLGFHVIDDYPRAVEIPYVTKSGTEYVQIPIRFSWPANSEINTNSFQVTAYYSLPGKVGRTRMGEYSVYSTSDKGVFTIRPQITRKMLKNIGASADGIYVRFEIICKGNYRYTEDILVQDSNRVRFVEFSSVEDTIGEYVGEDNPNNYAFVLKAKAGGGTGPNYRYEWYSSNYPTVSKDSGIKFAEQGLYMSPFNQTYKYDEETKIDDSAYAFKNNGKYVVCYAYDVEGNYAVSEVRRVYCKLDALKEYISATQYATSSRNMELSYTSAPVNLYFEYTQGLPFGTASSPYHNVHWYVNDVDVTGTWSSASGSRITEGPYLGQKWRASFPIQYTDMTQTKYEIYCEVEDAAGQKITSNKFTVTKK